MTHAARGLAATVHLYQRTLSPLLGSRCRFHPTCSEYARQAILRHGVLRGSYLALRRVGRCHPFGSGGFDEVPERFRWRIRDRTPEAVPGEDGRT